MSSFFTQLPVAKVGATIALLQGSASAPRPIWRSPLARVARSAPAIRGQAGATPSARTRIRSGPACAEPGTRTATGRAPMPRTATNILGTPTGERPRAARPTDGARGGSRMNARPAAAILGPIRKPGTGAACRPSSPGRILQSSNCATTSDFVFGKIHVDIFPKLRIIMPTSTESKIEPYPFIKSRPLNSGKVGLCRERSALYRQYIQQIGFALVVLQLGNS